MLSWTANTEKVVEAAQSTNKYKKSCYTQLAECTVHVNALQVENADLKNQVASLEKERAALLEKIVDLEAQLKTCLADKK